VAPGFSEAELAVLEQATPGEVHTKSREAVVDLTRATEAASLRRRFVLWTVLLLGVAVLSAMAWKLTRQMKNTG
jgi:hypothetical protein